MFTTADLCDHHPERVSVLTPLFRHFGARRKFFGRIVTIKCHEDNQLVREAVAEEGKGRVLVIDGGGSLRSALCGDVLARKAMDNGWEGLLIHGCVRDSAVLAAFDIGILALASNPWRPSKRREGVRDVPVTFADVRFTPGMWLYADEDGTLVTAENLASG